MDKSVIFAIALAASSLSVAVPSSAANDGRSECVAITQSKLGIASPVSLIRAVENQPGVAPLYASPQAWDFARALGDIYAGQQAKIAAAEATRRELDDFARLVADTAQIMPEQATQLNVVRQQLAVRYETEKQIANNARNTTALAISMFCGDFEIDKAYAAGSTTPEPSTPPPGPAVAQGGASETAEPEMTIMLGYARQSLNLRTNTLSPGPHAPGATAHLQSGSNYQGSVSVGGILPAGYTVYIIFHSRVWAVLSPTGGDFTVGENKGFGAQNDVDAVVCRVGSTAGGQMPGGCLYKDTDIDIIWQQ